MGTMRLPFSFRHRRPLSQCFRYDPYRKARLSSMRAEIRLSNRANRRSVSSLIRQIQKVDLDFSEKSGEVDTWGKGEYND